LFRREVDYDNYDWETETFAVEETVCIPQPLWECLCLQIMGGRTSGNTRWGNLSPQKVRALADLVVACPLEFVGRRTLSDQFINAGGIERKEIDFSNMQSKIHTGLFCCGQVLDVDGSYGGFNFMSAWATGHVAGKSAANYALELQATPSFND
jgi:predicted flavoprotein YhiN